MSFKNKAIFEYNNGYIQKRSQERKDQTKFNPSIRPMISVFSVNLVWAYALDSFLEYSHYNSIEYLFSPLVHMI